MKIITQIISFYKFSKQLHYNLSNTSFKLIYSYIYFHYYIINKLYYYQYFAYFLKIS